MIQKVDCNIFMDHCLFIAEIIDVQIALFFFKHLFFCSLDQLLAVLFSFRVILEF